MNMYFSDDEEELLGDNGEELTPAQLYCVTDFSNILDAIADGSIPTNTKKPFKVIFENEEEDENEKDSWFEEFQRKFL